MLKMVYPENIDRRSNDFDEHYHDTGSFFWIKNRALKENIVNLGTSTTTLKALTPRTFDWKAETDANDQTGFIAQEIEAVNSNLVSGEEAIKVISLFFSNS